MIGLAQLFSIFWIALLFLVFYLLILRPQQQRLKKRQELIAELRVGDRVQTIGGIQGRVVSLNSEIIGLEVAPNVVVTVSRHAVGGRLGEEEFEREAA